ncbi:MAG: transglycosylase domain-containing protein [Anaerolineales bacterium]|nr:MAG: transglycosylase domain-containing protein [Anaerolineales bacterium]
MTGSLPEDTGQPPEKQHPGEGATDRFRRLSASGAHSVNSSQDNSPQGNSPQESTTPDLSDTQPSRPVPVTPAGSTIAPDEAPTIFEPVGDSTPAPPPLGHTPSGPRPAMDEFGMPLPRRVAEVDPEATRVSRAAYSTTGRTAASATGNGGGSRFKQWWGRVSRMGCLPRVLVYGGIAAILLAMASLAFAFYEYYVIASSLPSVADLHERTSQFETTRILDANGNLLYEILDPNAGRRSYVPLAEISPYMVASTIAAEDKEFYNHPGFNVMSIARAYFQNRADGEIVSGASTITQQLARMLLFSPEEASQRTYIRKVREAILAAEITRRYSKEEILELYLNEIYFGNMAYGVEAAAETYFGTSASELTLAQASFLAGLPQSPSVYDVYTNREAALGRQQYVLRLIYSLSAEAGCIYVSNSSERVCVSLDQAATAGLEMLDYRFNQPGVEIRYPHWVHYIRSLLEAQYDPQTIYRSGFTVHTTLDPELQDMAQDTLSEHIAGLQDRNVGSGALVAMRPSDGHILAMVGSADFYNEEIDGQINMAVSPRQPGSSIKPLTYVAAFEKGWTASTLIWDVESEFPPSGLATDTRPPYIPQNYDERFHGPVTVRSALANSYNVPAVKALDFVGIYDNPDTPEEEGLVAFAHRLGITDLHSDQYGLALTLGGGEVKLLDLTNAYAIFANQGRALTPVAITRITDFQGNVIFEAPQPSGEQVIREEHAFLISSIMSDNQARTPMFGSNSLLNLPFPVAAKTGTTTDFRDNWTMGYTPDVAVGVWVGNPDNTEMQGTSGLSGAAPIWAEFMQEAVNYLTGGNPSSFVRPAGIEEKIICTISGAEPSQYCDDQRREYFVVGQPPADADNDLWQDVLADTWTGLESSAACGNRFTEERFGLNVEDPWAIKWITQTSQGRNWAEANGFDDPIYFSPLRECRDTDPRPLLDIILPNNGEHFNQHEVQVVVRADATQNFQRYVLEWARGTNPDDHDWEELAASNTPIPQQERVYTLRMNEITRGALSLRLTIYSTQNTYAEYEIVIYNDMPEPTAIPSATPTITPLPSATPTVTNTPLPTETPTNTPEPTATP